MKRYVYVLLFSIVTLTCAAQVLPDGFYISADCSTGPGINRKNLLDPKKTICLLQNPFLSFSEIISLSDTSFVANSTFFDVTITQKAAEQINFVHTNFKTAFVVLVVNNEVMFIIPQDRTPVPRRLIRIGSNSPIAPIVYGKILNRIAENKTPSQN